MNGDAYGRGSGLDEKVADEGCGKLGGKGCIKWTVRDFLNFPVLGPASTACTLRFVKQSNCK